jgi:hypothetical protein
VSVRATALALMLAAAATAAAQQRGGGAPQGPPLSAWAAAHFDLTGYWMPIITEDWRTRMTTAPRGDYAGVPLTAEGRKAADAWDPAADTGDLACRAYGVGGLMRMPLRLHITWADDQTLRLESDAGGQVRLLRFGGPGRAAPGDVSGSRLQPENRTWQGQSIAVWEKQPQARGFAPRIPSEGPGVLKVATTGMRPGYLRRNGVPYSGDAVITEYFVRHADFGQEWFTVITTVEDPRYLARPFITSTHFRREPDATRWNPRPCEAVPPIS